MCLLLRCLPGGRDPIHSGGAWSLTIIALRMASGDTQLPRGVARRRTEARRGLSGRSGGGRRRLQEGGVDLERAQAVQARRGEAHVRSLPGGAFPVHLDKSAGVIHEGPSGLFALRDFVGALSLFTEVEAGRQRPEATTEEIQLALVVVVHRPSQRTDALYCKRGGGGGNSTVIRSCISDDLNMRRSLRAAAQLPG
jgi:hypothetical protein